jgi:hypothetical protein
MAWNFAVVSGVAVEQKVVGQGAVGIQVVWQVVVRVISSLVYGQVGTNRCAARSATDLWSEKIGAHQEYNRCYLFLGRGAVPLQSISRA